MADFPAGALAERVLRVRYAWFRSIRRGDHVSLSRLKADGSRTPLTLPCRRSIKGSTLRTAVTQISVPGEEFLRAWE